MSLLVVTTINSNTNNNAEVKDTHRPPFMSPEFNLSKKNIELEGKEEIEGKRPRSNYDPVEVIQGWEYYLAMKEECGARRPRSNYDPVEVQQGWEFYFNNTNLFNV